MIAGKLSNNVLIILLLDAIGGPTSITPNLTFKV